MRLSRSALLACALIAAPALAHPGHELQLLAPEDAPLAIEGEREWLAGDHHVHSEYSPGYEADPDNPLVIPRPIFGRDGRYSMQKNAEMGGLFGLAWMVATDHGGPDHARINRDIAYPSLLEARKAVPHVLQFFGMEFDTPAGDHSSIIVPRSASEHEQLHELESRFSRRNPHPADPARDEPELMLEALRVMQSQPLPPVVIAHHPSRSATSPADYGRYDPAEFRDWNDTAPSIAVGMEGAPGHQAAALNPDGSLDPEGYRGGYRRGVPTMGGFDPMTARLGGLWDSLLGEGRRWWITAASDSHRHWTEGGSDFWPGEYSKTYVLARRDYADILDGIRHGRVFVTTGDLVSEVALTVTGADGAEAQLGGTLAIAAGQDVEITIRLRDPHWANAAGQRPEVARVDLIAGPITGPVADRMADRHSGTQVIRRFTSADWQRSGEVLTMRHRLSAVDGPLYLRLRGTNTDELEPAEDQPGEDPWADLWFYSNPVFVEPAR